MRLTRDKLTVSELLTSDDVKQMIERFISQDMPDCQGLVMLWQSRTGEVLIRTNLTRITCLGLFAMATQAKEL